MEFQSSRAKRKKLAKWLLAVDSAVDNSVFSSLVGLVTAYASFDAAMRRFRINGWVRLQVELCNEILTWGTIGLIFMFGLAQPAMRATSKNWRHQANYSITFTDRTGAIIGRRGVFQNKPIDLSRLPGHAIKATLATEDRRFYSHFGVDFIGIARAFATNLKAGSVVEGGSTITQQVAKNVFLSNERTFTRKAKEAFIALWLDANLTKDEILELYFNRAYLGGGAFGIPAAAEFYFDKDYADLTLAEAAMLAGLFKAPTNFAPHLNVAAARERANEVLTNMVEADFLTESQVLSARNNPASAVNRLHSSKADYFLDWLYDDILTMNIQEDRVLTVTTSLDLVLQDLAERAITNTLNDKGKTFNISQGAAVIMTPDGLVQAMVGGRDYGASQFNRAVDALRSPGSTFKAFVYSAAMEAGMTARTIMIDSPVWVRGWSPQNYRRRYSGRQTLTTALVRSTNTIPVKIGLQLGTKRIVDVARNMGVTSQLRANPSLPIGTSEVSVLDMTAGYAVFANGGYRAQPKAALKIYDSKGGLIRDFEQETPKKRVLQPESVASMNEILSQVPLWGTGRNAKLDGRHTAGKTGTTQAYRDAWFIGYTGNYVGTIWFGNDDYSPTRRLTGGNLPAKTWKEIMAFAHEDVPHKPIPYLTDDSLEASLLAKVENDDIQKTTTKIRKSKTLSHKSIGVLKEIGRLLDEKKSKQRELVPSINNTQIGSNSSKIGQL